MDDRVHAGQAVQPHQLDQRLDLRLGLVQEHRSSPHAQAAGQDRQVEHQRGVGEGELGQVDDDVRLGSDRARERTPTRSLR